MESGVVSEATLNKCCPNSYVKNYTLHTTPSKLKCAFTLAEGATHVATCNNCRKVAFTLAEVLITLGVIGVVAAMTIPVLIQNHKRQVVETQLKKAYSVISQAAKLSEIDNGDFTQIENVRYVKDEQGNYDVSTNNEWINNYVSKYILPYVKYVKKTNGTHIKENGYYTDDDLSSAVTIYTPDNISYSFHRGGVVDVFIDINGTKDPNEFGRDVFVFMLINNRVAAFCSNSEDLISVCNEQTAYCACVLYKNGWKIPKDYPIKL